MHDYHVYVPSFNHLAHSFFSDSYCISGASTGALAMPFVAVPSGAKGRMELVGNWGGFGEWIASSVKSISGLFFTSPHQTGTTSSRGAFLLSSLTYPEFFLFLGWCGFRRGDPRSFMKLEQFSPPSDRGAHSLNNSGEMMGRKYDCDRKEDKR